MGFREATLVDFAETSQAIARRVDVTGFLAVTADFNGDGKNDEARILLNEKEGVAYVVAVIVFKAQVDTYVLSRLLLQDAKNIGISPAAPLPGGSTARRSGLKIFEIDSGQGEANYFDGEDFNKRVAIPPRAAMPP